MVSSEVKKLLAIVGCAQGLRVREVDHFGIGICRMIDIHR